MHIIFNSLYRMMKNGAKVVNPAPVDKDTPGALWLSEIAKNLAPHLGSVGMTAWLWPPLTMAQGRSANNSDGYGKQFDLNIGQWYPTRWGLAIQVLAANKALHAAGLLVLEDAVTGQMDGGVNQHYIELGPNGQPMADLFPKFPTCFQPTVARDKVFDAEGYRAYGDMVSYDNCEPKGYMLRGVYNAMAWREDVLCLDGKRLDNTKGQAVGVTRKFLELGKLNICETFTGNPGELEKFVQETGGNVLDFTYHWAAKAACEGSSFHLWVWNGFWATNGSKAFLFADTGDTDLNIGENIRFNKLWAYVVGLMMPAAGMLIYAADYLPERYNLQKWIDNLCWISRTFAFGNLAYPFVDDTFIVFTRDGDGGDLGWSGGLTVAINSDPINSRGVWVKVPYAPGTHLHNYAPTVGNDVWVNNDSWAYIEAGPNINGTAQSYVCYAPAGVEYTVPSPPIKHEVKKDLLDFSGNTLFHQLYLGETK